MFRGIFHPIPSLQRKNVMKKGWSPLNLCGVPPPGRPTSSMGQLIMAVPAWEMTQDSDRRKCLLLKPEADSTRKQSSKGWGAPLQRRDRNPEMTHTECRKTRKKKKMSQDQS